MKRILEVVTGAKGDEIPRVLYCFFAIFTLLVSYYMVKPIRNSFFLLEFHPNLKPFFFLITVTLSLLATKIFNYFFDRIDAHQLLRYTFMVVIGFKLFFAAALTAGGKGIIIAFYFWATAYFLLCIAITWGCINFLFTPEQSKRCFGFIAVGGTGGGLVGSFVTAWMVDHAYKAYLLPCSAMIMAVSMTFMYLASKHLAVWVRPHSGLDSNEKTDEVQVSKEGGFFSDLKALIFDPYVSCIAMMVFGLAVSNTIMEFQSEIVIDSKISAQAFSKSFEKLKSSASGVSEDELFNFVYGFKSLSGDQKESQTKAFLSKHTNSYNYEDYQRENQGYRDQFATRSSSFFAKTSFYQSCLGIILLIAFSRFLFQVLGIGFAVVLLPSFFLIVIVALLFPIDLATVQIFMVIAGALNYSLNNATKEVLYTPTGPEVKGKYKPLIEGPMLRIGDFSAAILKIILMAALGQVLYANFYLLIGVLVILFWLFKVIKASKLYYKLEAEQQENESLKPS